MPPLPPDFEPDTTTISISSRKGVDWCYAYDPEAGLITWCNWTRGGWSDWHDIVELPPPPNWDVDGIYSFFSAGAHAGTVAIFSFNPEDSSLFVSPWERNAFRRWSGPIYLEEPPNLSDSVDIFAAGDEHSEWLFSVDLEDWSIFYTQWDDAEGEFTEWDQAPPITIPEEWLEMGIDLDGDARDGAFWLYATVYEDDY